MVRCARGEGAEVDTGLDRFEVGRGEDAVEPRHGTAAVEAVTGVDEAVAGAEIGEAAAAAAPLVAVAHQDRRQRLALGDMNENRAPILAAATPRKIQLPPDPPQPPTA